ncbi:MAG: DNA repair ATPase, partial [Chthoniobacteraceae bacterium]
MSDPAASPAPAPVLEQGTYEILRARLNAHGAELRSRLEKLNEARQEVFGAIKTGLVATERITTRNNCMPRDIIPIGRERYLLGYNVHVGLRSEIQLADVFAAYDYREHHFQEVPIEVVAGEQFEADFKSLYKYYKNTSFAKFSIIGPHLFMVFRVGKNVADIKTFKWLLGDEQITYIGNRFDHEFTFPPQHEFEWVRTHRELHRSGLHPHISLEDRVFVECVGGDLTIKIEDNTDSG